MTCWHWGRLCVFKKGKVERESVEQTLQFFLSTRYDVVFENNHSLDTFSTLVFVPGSKLESRYRSRETLTGLLRYTWCKGKAKLNPCQVCASCTRLEVRSKAHKLAIGEQWRHSFDMPRRCARKPERIKTLPSPANLWAFDLTSFLEAQALRK